MKKTVLLSALALVAGVLLVRIVQQDSGYILIAAFGKTIEMRLGFAVFMLIIGGLLLWGLVRLLGSLRKGWHRALDQRDCRTRQRTQRGLVHYLEGNWRAAERDLTKAAKRTEQPLVHYLAAARSAYELGHPEQAREYIQKARQTGEGNDLAVSLSQARIALLDNKFEQSLAILNRCKSAWPQHPVVLDLLHRVYLSLKDWRELEQLLPELERHRILPAEPLEQLAQRVYIGQLDELRQAHVLKLRADNASREACIEALQTLWKRLPKPMRQDPQILERYGAHLRDLGQDEEAGQLICRSLKQTWSPPLVELYSCLDLKDRTRQLQQVQKWLEEHPQDALAHLACGRVALRNEMWGLAREHFLKCLQLSPLPQAYAELGRLLAHMGEHELSTQYYQRGLMQYTQDLPSLPMPQA